MKAFFNSSNIATVLKSVSQNTSRSLSLWRCSWNYCVCWVVMKAFLNSSNIAIVFISVSQKSYRSMMLHAEAESLLRSCCICCVCWVVMKVFFNSSNIAIVFNTVSKNPYRSMMSNADAESQILDLLLKTHKLITVKITVPLQMTNCIQTEIFNKLDCTSFGFVNHYVRFQQTKLVFNKISREPL